MCSDATLVIVFSNRIELDGMQYAYKIERKRWRGHAPAAVSMNDVTEGLAATTFDSSACYVRQHLTGASGGGLVGASAQPPIEADNAQQDLYQVIAPSLQAAL